jgi:hypothetical protein
MIVTARARVCSRCPLFLSLLTPVLMLAGCWTVPVATVQPQGEPRLIQREVAVEPVKTLAVVSSVDVSGGTIALRTGSSAQIATYKVGPEVSGLNDLKPGDVVQATLAQALDVYLLRDGQLPGAAGAVAVDARVLRVDPSYRLLTLQYPDGRTDTVKVALGTSLEQMAPGDSVVIRPVAVLALRRKG